MLHRPARPDPGRRRVASSGVAALLALTMVLLGGDPALAVDPARDRQWALGVIGAGRAHDQGQGGGVVIAIVDSGVDLDHEDLAARIVPGTDLVDGDDDPDDEFGHGTHVAGIAAATGDNGLGILGVAPAAAIMPVRVLDEDGSGTSSDVTAGVRWAVDHGADVVNLSLGRTGQQVIGSGLTEAVRYAWDRGVVVVVSAGNDFVLSSGFADEPALVVSATTRDDSKPDYSSGVGSAMWGMAAPGGGCELLTCPQRDDILSTYWVEGRQDQYAYLQGTSMAAPHVAGAAAILRSLGLTPRQTVDRLLATAADIGPQGRDSTFGHGRLDLAAAVAGGADDGGGTPAQGTVRPEQSPPASAPAAPEPGPSAAPTAPGQEPDAASPEPSAPASPSPSPAATPTPAPSPSPGVAAPAGPEDAAGAPTGLVVLAAALVVAAVAAVAGTARRARRR